MPNDMTATISLAEWLKAKDAYRTMRLALCDIEGGVAGTLDEAKKIAARAVGQTPPAL